MSDTHETTADIRKDAEAKFRELVESYMQRRAAFQTTVGAMQAFNTVFDRLEAAHRRECGDCAKLREALESIASNLEHRLFARYPSSASDEWMYQKANTALAATEKEGGNNAD